MKRKLAGVLLALVLSVIGVFSAPATAQAAGGCYSNSICFYDTYYNLYPFANCEIYDCGVGDCRSIAPYTSYIDNRLTGYRWYVYTGSGCTGTRGTIYPRSQGSMNSTFNNNIRSYYRTQYTS